MKDPWDTTDDPMDPGQEVEVLSDRDRITVTAKAGKDFDAPWIVVHAKDLREANSIMGQPDNSDLISSTVGFATRLQAAYSPFKASASSAGSSGGGGGYRTTQTSVPAPSGAPSASCPVHGSALVYNAPFSSGGKQISGRLACPERGCRAITIWHNRDGSWKQG